MPDLNQILSLITPAEWQAILWLMLAIYSGTEVVKRLYRAMTHRYSANEIWLVSFAIGLATSYFIWPDNSEVWWFIAGACGGPMSNIIHKAAIVMLRKVSPDIANAITGERRKRWMGPPGGVERRASEQMSTDVKVP